MPVTVYGLASSKDEIIRYIGQTIRPINVRINQHMCDAFRRKRTGKASRGRRVWNWIKSVVNSGYEVRAIVLNSNAVLHETEIATIKHYREMGYNLVNATDGGEGTIGFHNGGYKRPDNITRNKLYTGCKRQPLSEEHKRKVSEGNTGKKHPWLAERNKEWGSEGGKMWHLHTDETKQKIGAAHKGKVVPEETRRKLSEAAKSRKLSAEGIAKLRAGHKRYHDAEREAKLASAGNQT